MTHVRDHQSRQYAMQLLNLTLAYVNKLIENATEILKAVRQGEGPGHSGGLQSNPGGVGGGPQEADGVRAGAVGLLEGLS